MESTTSNGLRIAPLAAARRRRFESAQRVTAVEHEVAGGRVDLWMRREGEVDETAEALKTVRDDLSFVG